MEEVKNIPSPGDSVEKKQSSKLSLQKVARMNCKNIPSPRGRVRVGVRSAFTRSEGATHIAMPPIKAKFAFTLAEILITLGIIGVVAAMTMPILMTAFAKHRVETKLVKFYSMINQTVRMSVADNETPEGWITKIKDYSYNENVEFLKTYIFPYLKISDYKQCSTISTIDAVCITNLDGTFWQFYIDGNGGDILYYIDGDITHTNPRNRFVFQFSKYNSDNFNRSLQSQNFVEPYVFQWDGTKDGLKNNIRGCYKGCTKCALCTKMIQLNSWKIPKDYPW